MGFCNRAVGNVRSCYIKDGFVVEKSSLTGEEFKYPTRLDVNIPEQCNLFKSYTVMFYLEHEGKVYIGRTDGFISIYRKSDMLLVGINNWDAPCRLITRTVGFYIRPNGVADIRVDARDRRTLYVGWRNIEALADKEIPLDDGDFIDLPSIDGKISDFKLLVGGDLIGVSDWNIQNVSGEQDYKVFV